MTILALEFSSERRSVALGRAGTVFAEAVETGGRAANACHLVGQALLAANIERREIGAIAVGLGPGSYTGIRAAIAFAQGWQLARGVNLMGISSVEAIAKQAQIEKIFGSVNVVVDAQRGEFYLATWHISHAELREISQLKIVRAEEIDKRQCDRESFVGPDAKPALYPTATALARLAKRGQDSSKGESLTPNYLREASYLKAIPTRVKAVN